MESNQTDICSYFPNNSKFVYPYQKTNFYKFINSPCDIDKIWWYDENLKL